MSIRTKRQTKFHFFLIVSLIAFHFLISLSIAVKAAAFVLKCTWRVFNPDDLIRSETPSLGANVSVCHTVDTNFNLRSHQLQNPGLELRRASESTTSTATATPGEVLQQLGEASLIRSETEYVTASGGLLLLLLDPLSKRRRTAQEDPGSMGGFSPGCRPLWRPPGTISHQRKVWKAEAARSSRAPSGNQLLWLMEPRWWDEQMHQQRCVQSPAGWIRLLLSPTMVDLHAGHDPTAQPSGAG